MPNLETFAQRASSLGALLLQLGARRSGHSSQALNSANDRPTVAWMRVSRPWDPPSERLRGALEATPLFEAKLQPHSRQIESRGGLHDRREVRWSPTVGTSRHRIAVDCGSPQPPAEIGVRLGAGPLITSRLRARAGLMRVAIDAILAEETYAAVVAAIGSSAETYPSLR